MHVEIREFFLLDLLCKFTLQIIENCIKLLGFFSLCFNLKKKWRNIERIVSIKEYSQSLG